MKAIDKVKIILQTIIKLMEKLEFNENKNGVLLIRDIEDIIKEKKLFENIDMERISSLDKNYINIEEFKNSETFYDILYEMFLNKIYKFTEKIANMALFNTFNQAYFYKKFLKYMSAFIDNYQITLNDDIIKEKLFEIVHSIQSSEKIYLQDFYFYISMFTIQYYYQKNDITFPEFEKFKDISFNNNKMKSFLFQLIQEKLPIIKDVISYLKYINSKSNLIQFFSTIEKEIKKNSVYNTENFDNFNWNETITDAEKKLFDYLKKNESDNNLILLKKCLENDNNKDKVFKFYFLDGMNSFLSLNEEDKYVIVNSYNQKKELSLHIMNYVELKNSYDEGMKKENTLKETIKNIIEDEQFFNDLKNIFTSEKVADYCKNPLQYYKGLSGIDIYDEKEKEKKKLKSII